MKTQRNTPKWDAWQDTVTLINGFGDNYTHPTGLSVNECLSESWDLQRLVSNRTGSPEGETQADRDAEMEGCVDKSDLDVILEFYDDLTERVEKLKALIKE